MHRSGITLALDAATLQREDITALLAKITAPTMVLCGQDDMATPVDLSHELAQRIPDARLEIIPGAGHHLPFEATEETTALVSKFLK